MGKCTTYNREELFIRYLIAEAFFWSTIEFIDHVFNWFTTALLPVYAFYKAVFEQFILVLMDSSLPDR